MMLLVIGALLLNPIVFLYLAAVFESRISVPKHFLAAIWIFSFSTEIACRHYGVQWNESANDDAPIYLALINGFRTAEINPLFDKYILFNTIEPIPKLIWYISSKFLSDFVILYTQTLLWISAISILCYRLSQEYFFRLLGISILLFPNLLTYELLHLYRSSWAMFFLSISLHPNSSFKKSLLSNTLAIFSHASAFLFAYIYYLIIFIKAKKYLFFLLCGVLLPCIAITLMPSIAYKIINYVGEGVSENRNYRLLKVTLFLFLLLCCWKERLYKSTNFLTSICVLATVAIISTFPILQPISDRLLILYLPILIVVIYPVEKKFFRYPAYAMMGFGMLNLLSQDSILRFSETYLPHPFNIPLLDFILYN